MCSNNGVLRDRSAVRCFTNILSHGCRTSIPPVVHSMRAVAAPQRLFTDYYHTNA